MSEWTQWFPVIKQTKPGYTYLYMQRTRRVPSKRDPEAQNFSLGRFDNNGGYWKGEQEAYHRIAKRINKKLQEQADAEAAKTQYDQPHGMMFAIFGSQDNYERPVNSLWNQAKEKYQEHQARAAEKKAKNSEPPAKAEGEAKSSFLEVGGNGDRPATAEGSIPASEASSATEGQAGSEK